MPFCAEVRKTFLGLDSKERALTPNFLGLDSKERALTPNFLDLDSKERALTQNCWVAFGFRFRIWPVPS
jgi:hypothetical protein